VDGIPGLDLLASKPACELTVKDEEDEDDSGDPPAA
jgi:hypothetical protein